MIAIFSDICYDFAQQPLLCCCRFCLDDRLRLEREVQFHENDISAEEETAVQSTRLQSENEQRWRKESAGSQKSKRKKEIIRIGRSNVAYFSMDFLYFYRRKRMKFTESLRKNRQFQEVYKTGVSRANKYLVMFVSENHQDVNYLGISVSRRVGNSVVRHRVKRLVKESYRLHEDIFNSGLNIVITARAGAASIPFEKMESAVLHLGKLHNIVKTSDH